MFREIWSSVIFLKIKLQPFIVISDGKIQHDLMYTAEFFFVCLFLPAYVLGLMLGSKKFFSLLFIGNCLDKNRIER